MRRGITLIEVLVSTALLGIIAVAVTNAYVGSIITDQRIRDSRTRDAYRRDFQDKVTHLLQGAYVTTASDDTASCFIGNTGQGGQTGSSNVSGNYADTLVFTTLGDRVASNTLASSDDFETQNQEFGPQGGIEEVEISLVPVGTPPVKEGLYLRDQRPADGDHTQGGYEQTLNADVTEIQFEFWDGASWQTTWDTTSMGTRRIPGAVRITYKMNGDDQSTIFVVRLPHSDVTSTNTVTVSTS